MEKVNSVATPRFLKAQKCAVRIHGKHFRNGTPISYVAYLFGVCALVLADGGTEDEAVAFFHDALEDQSRQSKQRRTCQSFWAKVRAVVETCMDTPIDYKGGEKPLWSWRERKTEYLKRLPKAKPGQLRVSLADKLDNVRSSRRLSADRR